MVTKEIDFKYIENKYQKNGYNAEKQMAFYLKRFFSDSDELFIINDLRLEYEGEIAQIDHLIIHRYGFIIIESKSVTSKIVINEYNEWVRNGRGMQSPILQAKLQEQILKKVLKTYENDFFDKIKFLDQLKFEDFKFDILVSISDSGIIQRHPDSDVDIVYKADQIPMQIEKIISNYKKQASFFSLKDVYRFKKEKLKKLDKFLRQQHKSKYREYFCPQCRSKDLIIKYKYNYYFKCNSCNKNISIKGHYDSCNKCGKEKIKISKEKEKFFKICDRCNTKELFFINRELETI